jgi:farnesyl-diphosphate farnesyltransferase
MKHASDSLAYMSRLRDPQVFRFCAIPQVMAIATLAACYDNANVFKKVVKIPRSSRQARLTQRD